MKYKLFILCSVITFGSLLSLPFTAKGMDVSETIQSEKPDNLPIATFGGGCFWCLESEFRALNGVAFTISGYSGGTVDNPTYEQVSKGNTGHAEVTDIYFDPDIISYHTLVDFFLRKAHDPTQLNRQGVDVGTQYRSVIFYHNEEQRETADSIIKELEATRKYKDPIVTTLEPLAKFWPAEDYHQQYYEKYEAANGRPHIRVLLKHGK